jgi:hypothetical protein
MPRKQEPHGKIYVANESFVGQLDGVDQSFHQNRTRVREGHPAVVKWPHLFDEMVADYEVEDASASPGTYRQ